MPPGPGLARALAAIDRSTLNGHDLVTVLQAWSRQAAHAEAELYATMAEVAHGPAGGPLTPPERLDGPGEFAADEIRAALRLTRRSADHRLDTAMSLTRLPRVWEALRSGSIDVPGPGRVPCRREPPVGGGGGGGGPSGGAGVRDDDRPAASVAEEAGVGTRPRRRGRTAPAGDGGAPGHIGAQSRRHRQPARLEPRPRSRRRHPRPYPSPRRPGLQPSRPPHRRPGAGRCLHRPPHRLRRR